MIVRIDVTEFAAMTKIAEVSNAYIGCVNDDSLEADVDWRPSQTNDGKVAPNSRDSFARYGRLSGLIEVKGQDATVYFASTEEELNTAMGMHRN